jgi:hypothetical protein
MEGLGASQWTPEPSSVANEDILNYFLSMVWTIQTTFSCSPLVSQHTQPLSTQHAYGL